VFTPLLERLDVRACEIQAIAHDNVADAAEAVLATAPPRFVALGFSLGGFVVLELLRRAPDRLVSAVLIASNAHPLQPSGAQSRRDEVARARASGLRALIDELWPSYVAPGRLADKPLKQVVVSMAEDVGIDRFAAQAELAIGRPDSRATVRESAVPLLALCGDRDAMSSPERCAVFAKAPQTRLVELSGVGHFIPLEAPDAAAHAVTKWMRELPSCC
jgi:pimeloyl-ACP methyl ester carboxylesterase